MKKTKDYGYFVLYKKGETCLHQSGLPALSKQPFRYNNRVTPPLEEGDIVFFPSNLEHYVSNNTSDQVSSTISANFVLSEKQDD